MSLTFAQLVEALPAILAAHLDIVGDGTKIPDPASPFEPKSRDGRPCTWLHDRVLVSLLRAWARQPWVPAHGSAVADRLEEMLLPARASTARQAVADLAEDFDAVRTMKRGRRRRHLANWTAWLKDEYGDFKNSLPEKESQTPCQ